MTDFGANDTPPAGPASPDSPDAVIVPPSAPTPQWPAAPSPAYYAPPPAQAAQQVPGYLVRWGIPSSIVGLAVFIVALALGITLYVVGVLPNASVAQFVTNVLAYGAMFGLVVLVVRRRGSGSLAADIGLRFRWIDLLLGLAAAFVAKLIAVFFAVAAQRLAGDTPVQGNLQLDSDTFWIVLNAILFACLIGPFVEEVFFRGLLLRGIRNRVLRTAPGSVDAQGYPLDAHRLVVANAVGIVVSAVVFMALHLYESSSWESALALGGATLFLGLINAALAVLTRRLGAGIVAHVLFNASSVLALLAAGAS